jgi:hypothetical protein
LERVVKPSVSFVAECFWTGVTEQDVRALDERIHATVADLGRNGAHVRYSGSLLMPTDEVVLCLFEGTEDVVRLAAQRAGVPFERIVPASSDQLLMTSSGGDGA